MADIRDPDFYLTHASYVRALARRMVYEPHAADDLFQAAWLAALQRPDRSGATPRRWLASIVHNLASKAWLRAKRRAAREAEWRPASVSSPADVLAHEQERQRVVEALLALEEPYRATLIGRFFDGLEPAQLAARDGVPVETVRTRTKRGLQRLRERLLSGRASAFALVSGLRLGAPDLRTLALHLGHGVLWMHAKKSIVVAALVLLGAAGWWVLREAKAEPRAAAPAGPVAMAHTESTRPPTAAAPTQEADAAARTALQAPAAATTGTLVVRVAWSDERPATGAAVRVGYASAPNFERSVVVGRTGDGGRVRFDGLPAGEAVVESDRGAWAKCRLDAGTTTEAHLVIPRGVRIQGHVADIDGGPAVGAEVYLLWRPEESAGHVVARADDDGAFTIDDAPAERPLSLSARQPQRAPTRQTFVMADAGATVDVDLQFEARGGCVEGRVLDERGEAVASATVLVGPGAMFEWMRAAKGGGHARPLSCQKTTGNNGGDWSIDGVAPGDTPVLVVAAGMAPWTGRTLVVPGQTVRCNAVLSPAPRIVGTVRDESGMPRAHATLRVGQWGMEAVATTSGADGSFELGGLPLGTFEVLAQAEGAGEARETFTGVAGDVLRWNPGLRRATTLHGRVLAAGKPVRGAQVAARCMPSARQQWFAEATSDADGRFELTNCPDALLHLDVRTPSSGPFLAVRRDDVDPHGDEVLLEVDLARAPTAFAAGRVLGPDGQPAAGAEVAVLPIDYEWGGGHVVKVDADGRFRSPGCSPGEWYLTVNAPGFAQLGTTRRGLNASATTDWGDLVLARGVVVVVNLQAAPGVDVTGLALAIGDADSAIAVESPTDSVVRFANIAPGDHMLTAYARGVAQRRVSLQVGRGPETVFDLQLVAGSEVRVKVLDSRGEPVIDRLETELRDSKGECLDRTPLTPSNEAMCWSRRLVADHYVLRLRDHRGRDLAVPLVVEAGKKPVSVVARWE
ncbi:MAG: sigma-70 family RNA polymerase sigma factor [Planctomycetota bacterium]